MDDPVLGLGSSGRTGPLSGLLASPKHPMASSMQSGTTNVSECPLLTRSPLDSACPGFLTAMGAGEWVAGAGEGRPIVVASNHHGLVETELLADPLGTHEDTTSAAAADGKHKVCHRMPTTGLSGCCLAPVCNLHQIPHNVRLAPWH